MTEIGSETREIRSLIEQTDKIVAQLERMLPAGTGSADWLGWRIGGLRRRLDTAKRDLCKLVEQMQAIMVAEKVVEARARKQKP